MLGVLTVSSGFTLKVADPSVCRRHGGEAGTETGRHKGAGQHLHFLHFGQRVPHRCVRLPRPSQSRLTFTLHTTIAFNSRSVLPPH